MTQIENGGRYQAVKDSLNAQAGVIIVGEITTQHVNNRKSKVFEEVRFAVAPEAEQNVRIFAEGLLPDVQPLFRHDERLRTFDRLGDGRFRTVTVEVYPNRDLAEEAKR